MGQSSEKDIQNEIRIATSKMGMRVFRNSTGVAFREKSGEHLCEKCRKKTRVVKFGLCVGSSDLIGWMPVVITEELVGKTVGVFIALEVKTPKGRVSKEQQTFIREATKSGGIAAVVRSKDDIKRVVEQWRRLTSHQ